MDITDGSCFRPEHFFNYCYLLYSMRHRIWGCDLILRQKLGKVNRSFLAEKENSVELQSASASVKAGVALKFLRPKEVLSLASRIPIHSCQSHQ